MNLNKISFYSIQTLLVVSVVALLTAPLLMPASYDWIVHTTSESAAQGIEGAWLARLGFVLYGLAVLLFSSVVKEKWTPITVLLHVLFGLGMIGNAIFSSRPWEPDLPFHLFEDTLHSWMSGLVGTAFTLGVLFVFFQRQNNAWTYKAFDIVAISTSIVVTVGVFMLDDIAGLLQRIMFAVSYIWYAITSKSVSQSQAKP